MTLTNGNSHRGMLAVVAVSMPYYGAPLFAEKTEHPHQMWRRGLLPRRWRSRMCGCAACRASWSRRWS